MAKTLARRRRVQAGPTVRVQNRPAPKPPVRGTWNMVLKKLSKLERSIRTPQALTEEALRGIRKDIVDLQQSVAAFETRVVALESR